jgi:hypothetical protein
MAMPGGVEEQYLDVLLNLETAIVAVYSDHPDLTDHNVHKAIDGLIRAFQAEQKERSTPTLNLKDLEQQVYAEVLDVCEWRLGRVQPADPGESPTEADIKTLDEMLTCLKIIRRSIGFWTKESGRQGYLNYVSSFLRR